eukprot:4010847-Pyramimonas_sp.AAC.1
MPDGCSGNLGAPHFHCQELHLSARSQQNTTPRPHFECPGPAVGHFVFFVLPEHHSQATF